MCCSRALPYLAASTAAAAADLSVLSISRRAGVAVWLAALFGCLAGGVANFAVQRKKVFVRATTGVTTSAIRYALLVVLGGALLTSVLMSLGVSLGLPFLIARGAVGLVVLASWNYPISKRVVFKEETCHASS